MFQIIRTGIDASNRDLAIISNNIANAGTNGFKEVKHSLKMFTDLSIMILLKKQEELV